MNNIRKPPSFIEAEKNIISALLIDNDSYDTISDLLKPEYFYDEKNKLIYQSIQIIFSEGKKADTIALYQQLKKDGTLDAVGGLTAIQGLLTDINSSARIKQHTLLVLEKFLLRSIIRFGMESVEKAYNEESDPHEITNELLSKIEQLQTQINFDNPVNLKDEIDNVFDGAIESLKSEKEKVYTSTYLPSFNDYTSGLLSGNLLSIQGKDKAGKTTLAYTLALDFAINGNSPTGIFSLEMTIKELLWKAISLECELPYNALRNPKGHTNEAELEDKRQYAKDKFNDSNIFVIDKMLNEFQIYIMMKRLKRTKGVNFFVVDYIGLIEAQTKHENREKTIGYLSRFFKKTAKDLEIVICILSQQNRDGGIAESKGLERDSDFSLSIEKPYDDDVNLIKINGQEIKAEPYYFVVTLKRSRHSIQGKGTSFLCGYDKAGKFRELDIHTEKLEQLEF